MVTHLGDGSMEVYIYILLVLLGCTEIEAANSECEAPAAQKGSVAFVTCRFDSDISKLRQDFEVRHVPVNVSVMNAEVVISCYWNQEKSFCRSRPDYQLDSQITNQFTVKITEVGNQHAGKFICMLVSHNPGTYGYCELVVTDCIYFRTYQYVEHTLFHIMYLMMRYLLGAVVFILNTYTLYPALFIGILCFSKILYSDDTQLSMDICRESRSSTFPTLLTTKPSSFKEVSTRSVRYNVATSGFSILNGNGSDQHKEMTSPLTTDVHGNSLAIALSITVVLMILTICAIFFILRKFKRECCKRIFKEDKGANQTSTGQHLNTLPINLEAKHLVKINSLDIVKYKADLQPFATHRT